MINRMIKLLKFSGLLLLIMGAFIWQVSGQPQNPPPPDDPVPVVEDRQADRADDRDERDRVQILLLPHVGAEVRGDPRPRDARDARHDGEHPERDRADAEQVRDDVLRKAGNQIEDEAENRALRLDDEVHAVPVVLAEPGPDERLAPESAQPEAHERPDRQSHGRG